MNMAVQSIEPQSIEATLRTRYAAARARLFAPDILEKARAEKRREAKAKAQRDEMERFMRAGMGRAFVMKNPSAYWFEGILEPRMLASLKEMYKIAEEILAKHKHLSLADLRRKDAAPYLMRVRRQVVHAIHEQRPDISFAKIGEFMNRDHTSISHILGTLSRTRKST